MMKEYALITGASKGIGKSISIELAQRGYNVLLIARSEESLLALKDQLIKQFKVDVQILALDLSDRESAIKLHGWILTNNFPISVLINNAGFGLYGQFYQQDLIELQNMLDLNIKTLTAITHLLVPVLKKQEKSYILNVASTAAFQSMPFMGVYAATKAFVLSFSRALRYELKASGISVSCLCPGPVKTAFWERANAPSVDLIEKISKDPEEIARVAVRGMFAGKSEVFVGGINRLGAFSNRLLPKNLIEKVAAGLFSSKAK